MASSFSSQIPGIIYLITKLNPSSVLDVGKGFRKYAFLIHEYIGIDNKKKIDNTLTLKQLSSMKVDAVEIDKDLMLPYLEDLYEHIYFGDIKTIYAGLPKYDLVLMIDTIEHIEKVDAINILKYFLKKGTN